MSDRSARLSKHFSQVEQGKKKVDKTADAKLFLEAVCGQTDALRCVEKLASSSHAIQALQNSLRFDISEPFLNGPAADFLTYLRAPGVEQLGNGLLLRKIILTVVDPPAFWNALVGAHGRKALTEGSEVAFAWLLLQLVTSPSSTDEINRAAKAAVEDRSILDSPFHEVRSFGYKIQNILNIKSTGIPRLDDYNPGGRHDNDFEDFRKIAILPTPDEISSTETPFYRKADEVYETEPHLRPATHYDNQFRLLREDFLAELRNDLQISQGKRKGRRSAVEIHGLRFKGLDCGTEIRRKPCSLTFLCQKGLPPISAMSESNRRLFIKENKIFLKHQSFGCLMQGREIVAFASLDRNEDLLLKEIPVLVLQVAEADAVTRVLARAVQGHQPFHFIVVDTAVFAYEPVLRRLQEKTEFPLSNALLSPTPSVQTLDVSYTLSHLVQQIRETKGHDIHRVLGISKPISLDPSQLESLLASLGSALSLIQGPPGTGKSFMGAILAKILHDYTTQTILVICYTNHALDQFLEDLMDIGIPDKSMVRLGAKSSDRTKKLGLTEQSSSGSRTNTRRPWAFIYEQKDRLRELERNLREKLTRFQRHITRAELMEHLEFSAEDFYEAFLVPEQEDGMQRVGKGGKQVHRYYLLDCWMNGHDAGVFRKLVKKEHDGIWKMSNQSRRESVDNWRKDILRDDLEEIARLFKDFNRTQHDIEDYFHQTKDADIFQQKRVIACTTTAAAKYAGALEAANAGVILVEEAGEILESHILTSMTRNTKQLVLIGDHKQLRPKVNNYSLTVEKGDGFDLNRSMFERLVLRGYPHTTLLKQHRMRPGISQLIRHLTYPDLQDAEKTQNRPALRGLQNTVVFVNHEQPELDLNGVSERRDPTAKASKENPFEVEMVLKCVRYLGQQGYGTERIVVLVPYLGQLFLLRNELSKNNDPVLNDLDSHDLVRAGLLAPAGAQMKKRPILISTIDNYQGEERDIVIASLTRSNGEGDVGFMAAPERLNVLLSRARNGLIVIGNFNTFRKSRKAKTAWEPLLTLLTERGQVYDGFPVKCERHPSRTAIIRNPQEFEIECPDGGCADPCTSLLRCGVHTCPQRCHQLSDHSKMDCNTIIESTCPQKHRYRWRCHKGAPASCPTCEREKQIEDEKRRRDFELERKREARQREHAKQLAEVQQRIEEQKQIMKDVAEEKERQNALAQKIQDLNDLMEKAELIGQPQPQLPVRTSASKPPNLSAGVPTPPEAQAQAQDPKPTKPPKASQMRSSPSAARDEWERQKTMEGQSNKSLDALMRMIGLEEVKDKFLSIKAKVDTVVRQNTSLKDERFGAALLGNPGTGKTTVARLYAKFLGAVGVIPGDFFVETSGSRLASDGIPGCKKHLEAICNNGGGALFIDEAYQLVSGQNYGGSQVLDFLLAEVENLTGKVVFILAGYSKNMEAFFAHNPGIPSRFPIEFQFRDYEDAELQSILRDRIDRKYSGGMTIEGDPGGLYMRIVSRRIGRGRGRDGFGNARAVHNEFSRIADRQAKRLQHERRAGARPDDMLLTKEDLLGPEPGAVLKGNAAWGKLQKLTGLESVKQAVRSLLDTIQFNYGRELEEKPLVEYSLNKVFVGNPGTGKTTVAKLYGQILADMGFLSSGEVVVKNPSDFVGNVLGASESTTRGILASTVGKVLVIDEAYMLSGGSSSASAGGASGAGTDPYKAAVVDTIVAEVQSVPGDDRCVLLLGYKDLMETMFQNVNPALARRFPMDSAFYFEDYTDDDLQTILDLKLGQIGFGVTPEAKKVVRARLGLARDRPHFGNAGEVDILLDRAKMEHQKRLSSRQTKSIDVLEALDFDPDFRRAEQGPTNCRKLFDGVVGCEDLIQQLEGYQRTVANMKKLDMDPREQIPFSFLFRGPPGTGKTSTARRMGKIFYDMGFLATAEVVECSATDLVGQYVGQTGPKTQKLLEKALGKVLLIDEAYRLAEGHFAQEAMDELVDCLTKPKFAQKLIVILAGYDNDIDRLMSANPGLTSRFPETITFQHLSPKQCLELFQQCLRKGDKLDSAAVLARSETFKETLLQLFKTLAQLPAWGNARDVKTLAKSVTNKVLSSTTAAAAADGQFRFEITEDTVLLVFRQMVSERERRQQSIPSSRHPTLPMQPSQQSPHQAAPMPPAFNLDVNTAATAHQKLSVAPLSAKVGPSVNPDHQTPGCERDPGVSDEIWAQLQCDQHAADEREHQHRELLDQEQKAQEQLQTKAAAEQEARRREEEESIAEARRLLEQERLRRELEWREQVAIAARLEQARKAREQERRKEEAAQAKLRQMGVCVAGFRWIKQATGYRCAGGSHYISNEQLGM